MTKRMSFLLIATSVSLLILAGAADSVDKTSRKAARPPLAAATQWTTPVNVSNDWPHSEAPQAAVDGSGKVYVVWTNWKGGLNRDIMFNTNKSGQWETPSLVTPIFNGGDDVGFPSIAATSDGTVHFGYHDAGWFNGEATMEVFWRQYSNGVWADMVQLANTPGSSTYVNLSVSPVDNTLFAAWMEDVTITDTFELALRYKDGLTGQWSDAYDLHIFSGSSKYWPNLFIDKKDGTGHLVFITRSGEAAVWYSKNPTPKNPNTWTAPVNIAPGTGLDWSLPRVVADANGDAYVVWYGMVGGAEEVFLRKTINGAWQPAENISQSAGQRSESATIAVNPETKEIYIAWQEFLGSDWEIYIKTYEEESPGGQKTWSAVTNFSNNPLKNGEPFMRIAPNGAVHLFYFQGTDNEEIMYSSKQTKSITVTSPNGGESWQAGTTHNITWTTQGTVANVKIELSTNGGTGYSTIIASTPNNGSYAWTVPNTPSANCLVRISDAANASNIDVSDSAFTIAPSPITVTSPNGGESWQAGTAHNITWTIQGATVANVKIELSTNGGTGYSTIIASTPNNGSYAWTVPNTPSTNCLVRISDAANASISNVSDSAFTITPPPSPPLSPAIDTRLNADETKKINKITWAANPLNAAIPLKNYKIYRKPIGAADSSFVVISSASSSVLQYEDSNLDIATRYAYRLTSLSTFDVESEPSSTVTESRKFEFPPLNAALQTTFNRILFYREKNNTITFEKNAFNDDNDVNGYRIYRKKATDDDDQFVAIKTLDSSTFSHKDARLPIHPTYAYAVTTVYKDGRESRKSATVTEK